MKAFENIVEREEIARNEQFLLFPQCFLLNQIIVSPFVHIFDIISLFVAEFEKSKIDILGKGLTLYKKAKILNWSILKAFADDKIKREPKIKIMGELENIVEKAEMLATSILCFFHNVFQSFLLEWSLKVKIGW